MITNDTVILIADPRILAIPVHENHEPMVNLIEQNIIKYGPPPLDSNNTNYTYLRKRVYEKLVQAQKLLPNKLKFCLYEGHRNINLQKKIFDERYDALKKAYPHMTHEECFIETTKFASPVINLDGSKNIPPHLTGGAIDVYLLNENDEVVDMGIHLDDTYNDIDGIYCKTNSEFISNTAKAHRNIMSHALSTVGFINLPTEYWHWSYGDRYWAYLSNQPAAIYGILN